MRKQNCWEFTGCGRDKEGESGICPAVTTSRANGINGGTNGGRVCWVVAGTFCEGLVQGTYAQKVVSCSECAFRERVKTEEGYRFTPIFF